MKTLNDIRANITVHIQSQMDPLRSSFGEDIHAMHCLGCIDGAAASLGLARGPEHAAMALYQAADAMVEKMPAKVIALPKRSHMAGLVELIQQQDPYIHYLIGLTVGFIAGWFA